MTDESQTPEQQVTVLPDATRTEMLEAAGMTTGQRWEDAFITKVSPDPDEDQDEGFTRSRTS